jgi:hypothetical protein
VLVASLLVATTGAGAVAAATSSSVLTPARNPQRLPAVPQAHIAKVTPVVSDGRTFGSGALAPRQLEDYSVTYDSSDFQSGQFTFMEKQCPAGTRVIGGGGLVWGSPKTFITDSYARDERTWRVWFHNRDSQTVGVGVSIACAK